MSYNFKDFEAQFPDDAACLHHIFRALLIYFNLASAAFFSGASIFVISNMRQLRCFVPARFSHEWTWMRPPLASQIA